MADLRPVPVGKCRCPGTPHPEGDVVYLAPELSTPAGIAAQAGLMSGGTWPDRLSAMTMGLMRHSVREWTFRDEKGSIPVTPERVESELPWLRGGKEVADACADLYAQIILTPFVEAFRSTQAKSGKKTRAKPLSHAGSTEPSST